MYSEYNVLLDPALEITAADLAAAWAEIPVCAEAGQCAVKKGDNGRFTVDLGDATTLALITFGATLAKDLAVELVKRAITRAQERQSQKSAEEVVVEHMPDPVTGLPILRITRKS